MIKLIKDNIVFVKGACGGAIYDFITHKVYAINEYGCDIIIREISNSEQINQHADAYLKQISQMLNITGQLQDIDYVFPKLVPKLSSVWLEITQQCNCKCIHCYEGDVHKNTDSVIDFKKWLNIIDEIAMTDCKEVRFIGGEPTLYPHLEKLIEYASNKKLKIVLLTNFLHVSQKLLDLLKNTNTCVKFSLYGKDEQTHDKITQIPGSFHLLTENIVDAKKIGINLQCNIVVMKENESQREEIVKYINSLGIKKIHSDEIRKSYFGHQQKHLLKNGYSKMKKSFYADKKMFDLSHAANSCWYGRIVISNNGETYPCIFSKNFSCGNIIHQSLKEIIYGDKIRKYWLFNYSNVEPCNVCEFRFACRDCRPLAFMENGNMVAKNPKCFYDPNTNKWL